MTKKVPDSETDINAIVKRFQKTGQLPPVVNKGVYMDCFGVGDCRENMERIKTLQDKLAAEYALLSAPVKEEKKKEEVKKDEMETISDSSAERPIGGDR